MAKALTRTRWAVALVVVCGFAATAAAQDESEPGPESEPAEAATPGDDAAIAHYLAGEEHYAAGRYELAIQEFEKAFELSGKPELHFNIANCHERAGNYEAAAEALEKFLRSGSAPNPDALRERVWRARQRAEDRRAAIAAQVEEQLAEERRREPVQEPEPREPPALDPAATVTTEVSPGPSRMPAYVALGVGAAAVTAALIFAGIAHDAGGDAEQNCEGGLCKSGAESALDREKRYARLADVSGFVGLAALGLGGYLWYRSGAESSTTIAPTVSESGVGFALGARF